VIHLVMGGQYGSEGKGEFVAWLASRLASRGQLGAVVRVGGPNAGHTMTVAGVGHKMRQVPCGWHVEGVPLIIGPGSLIDPRVLRSEMERIQGGGNAFNMGNRVFVDREAIIIQDHHRVAEHSLKAKVGSTREGIGAARSDHIMRNQNKVKRAYDYPPLPGVTVEDTTSRINSIAKDIIIESTQGFGLSLSASLNWPKTTSRDVTPGVILSDAGLSSRKTHQVYSVNRTFPIRVAGNSGFLHDELSWEDMSARTGGYIQKPETTTVTGLVRRIGIWDVDLFNRMMRICKPDSVVLTFMDYLDPNLAQPSAEDVMANEVLRSHDSAEIRRIYYDIQAAGGSLEYVAVGPGQIREVW
jgi:adenylosuccinate synthase